ncbi:aminoglycoside adenylyltransferase domain-containing protein [Actinoplanes solisilvae]|uniref:aminoglycoside adenylyltransferase domain-containing protein n=1 Tax=Actinoplanes solisilvae TaxID=2486853 RepID=UPI0013E2A7A8|nr:aminoglycoside adenylyltransferase domain-containing protein [Actinoplanes solisilvae]
MNPRTDLAPQIAGIVGPTCRAVILHGSLASGGFRPGHSDVDLLVVVNEPLTDARADSLTDHLSSADLGDAAGLDVDVVTAAVARHPTPAPPLELHVSLNPTEIERGVPTAPDLPAELSIAKQDGITLYGDPAVLAPVPAEWVIARGRHWLNTWQSLTDDEPHAAFMVLTACRIWHFAATGVHAPKARAARWALTRSPSLTAIDQALQQYEGRRATVVEEPAIAAVLEEALRRTG